MTASVSNLEPETVSGTHKLAHSSRFSRTMMGHGRARYVGRKKIGGESVGT